MTQQIRYDYSFMMSDVVGKYGAQDSELTTLQSQISRIRSDRFNKNSPLGFMSLSFDTSTISHVTDVARRFQSLFKTLLVLGIGGSDLGARAVIAALPSSGMNILFLGGNTDPREIHTVLESIEWKTTAVNVISKSGDTIETMSTFLYVRNCLITAVGKEEHAKHIVATTDIAQGTLRTMADREGYDSLIVPDSVGGRFSVLSPVGLFPIACSGIDITELCHGARDYCNGFYESDTDSFYNCELFAALHYLGFSKRHQNVHVLIPYAAGLSKMGFWFRQLWAESLGKKDTLSGQTVFTGPTPVAALGATDQHSQFQLYYYGPYDKLITFVDVEDYESELAVPGGFDDIEGLAYMKGLSFSEIIRTELKASALALAERQRPNGRLIIPNFSAYYIGQLIQFFEIATVCMGDLLQINPFDQPGVELGKHNMYALFGRSGYEKRRDELEIIMKKYEERVS